MLGPFLSPRRRLRGPIADTMTSGRRSAWRTLSAFHISASPFRYEVSGVKEPFPRSRHFYIPVTWKNLPGALLVE